jgi:acetolactate synthase I/II/III large subunit
LEIYPLKESIMELEKQSVTISGAELIAQTLKGYGITHVFFIDAILRRSLVEMETLGIRRVLAHSEKAAAYMADGYSRVRRGPGICMSQSVGAANLAAGLQDGYLDLSAIIAITGKKEQNFQHKNAYQEVDHEPLFKPVTKFNASVETIEQLPSLLRQAFREATTAAPGPVHLDVPNHMGATAEQWEFRKEEVLIEESYKQFPAQRPQPEKTLVRRAAELLQTAKKPVIVSGGGAIASSAFNQVAELAEKLSAPVVTSLNGKNILPESHPMYMGVVGTYSRQFANQILSEADLVLFIGSRTGDMVTATWNLPVPGTQVIQIDIEAKELGRNFPNIVSLLGDAKVITAEISENLNQNSKTDKWAVYCQKIKKDWLAEMEILRTSTAAPIHPERLCKELGDVIPENAVLVADTGYSSFWTGIMVYLNHPEQTYIRAAGSLGWALPASLGAKCAAPDRPVICFTGDAGFWYHLSELETAKRCGINTIIIVNNNSGFSQCEPNIKRVYGKTKGNAEEMYKFSDINFSRIAEEMGCAGIRVKRPEDISTAMEKALSSNLPTVIEVITDINCKAQL